MDELYAPVSSFYPCLLHSLWTLRLLRRFVSVAVVKLNLPFHFGDNENGQSAVAVSHKLNLEKGADGAGSASTDQLENTRKAKELKGFCRFRVSKARQEWIGDLERCGLDERSVFPFLISPRWGCPRKCNCLFLCWWCCSRWFSAPRSAVRRPSKEVSMRRFYETNSWIMRRVRS